MQENTSMSHVEKSLPWYRYGMVWMVIALPLIVVAASMVTISIAFSNPPQVISGGKIKSTIVKEDMNASDASRFEGQGD